MSRSFFITFSLVLILLVLPVMVWAERAVISGGAELRYAEQSVETGGVQTVDASHFIQQYSFLWSKKDNLNRGRLGKYDLSLGYEWSSVDSEINGQKVAIDNPLDKILYRGELTLAPGGLPFRLQAFSRDMKRTTFIYEDLGTLSDNDSLYRADVGIVSDVNNGTHVTTGVKLEVGVQNGDYAGMYRDVLSALPRLLIDYKQLVVHDVKGPSPLDYVDTDLAFVSLNKKNNWFHYRRFEHEDKIDSTQSTSEDTLLLGTIDNTNRRQWVNLTNWIKASADISYNEERGANSAGGLGDSKRYDINLFSKARRTRWQLDNFTTFTRRRSLDRLENSLEVPFYARGELNRDTAWRFQLVSRQYKEQLLFSGSDRVRDTLYMRGQVDAYRQARYIVRPELEVETKSGTEGRGQNGKIAFELSNNPLYRSRNDLFARYSAALYSGISQNGRDVSFVEQMMNVRLETQLNSTYRVGGEQKLVYGTGRYDISVTQEIYAELSDVATFEGRDGSFDDDLLRSESSLYVEISSQSGLRNRFELNYDMIDGNTITGSQFGLGHRLEYTKRALSVIWTNDYLKGDGIPDGGLTRGTQVDVNLNPTAATELDFASSFSSTLRINYSPGRSSRLVMTSSYEGFNYTGGTSIERVQLDEQYEYSFWHVNGRVRKLLVLGEIVEYDQNTSSSSDSQALLAFSLFSNYYPTAHTLLSSRIRYEQDDVNDSETLLTYLTAGLNYEKFQVSLDYSYGRRSVTVSKPEVLEHKWEVKVKKTF